MIQSKYNHHLFHIHRVRSLFQPFWLLPEEKKTSVNFKAKSRSYKILKKNFRKTWTIHVKSELSPKFRAQ